MRDDHPDGKGGKPPEPSVVDVQDWPPRTRSDEVREKLDREVGTLGITSLGSSVPGGAGDPEASAEGEASDRR